MRTRISNSTFFPLQWQSAANLEAAINEWIDEKANCRKASTTAKYRYMSSVHIIPYIGHIKLNDINVRIKQRIMIMATARITLLWNLLARDLMSQNLFSKQ